jgi:hypothetical protein
MTPPSSPPAQSQMDVPDLRSLGPEYDAKLHGRHAEVLLKVLSDATPSAARNIALAGHYGSGKSSVILGVQAGLDKRKIEWVNLSMSSLGIDDTKRARVQNDGTLAPLTNLIQKEIVKQLLYRKAPADMPGSRYFRIDSFRTWRALQWAAAAAIGVFAIAVLLGLVDRVRRVAPATLLNGHAWVPWLAVGLLGVFVGAVCFLALRGLQNPVRVDSVSAGGAAVSLSAKENSYFDEYLDEIVYFFQRTKTKVAIFEDLDRFKDPHIFETLRELNTVLNNSEQVKARPVRFVYAVRDSIFEQLEADADPADSEAVSAAGPLRAAAQESSPSANRTKFFDMVVPMVPFITHRSARDLLAAEFENSPQRPSLEVINLVGGARALTDMRLIRNIRNEFEIYRASVLGANGLQGLTADRLFAMMVYKNTHLEDFEAIRLGTSRIDLAHRAFREMVEYQVSYQIARSRAALAQAHGAIPWNTRAKAAGERLQRVLPIVHKAGRRGGGEPQIVHSSGNYSMSDLTSGELWKSLFESRGQVQLGTPGYGALALSFNEFMALAGDEGLAMEDAVEADVAELQRRSRVALETKELVTKATMAELLARTDLKMPADGDDAEEFTLHQIVSTMVSPLALELLAKGYIDENFTLYCSDYHDVAISVSAMNFILHCVQADRADHLFRFDRPASIEAVENEVGDRFLGGESVFNVAVFDHYLAKDSTRLDSAIDRLVVRAIGGDTSFLDLYFEDDAVETKDRLVSALAPRWAGLFVYLVEATAPEQEVGLFGEAIHSAVRGVDYESSDSVTEFIAQHYTKMSPFTEPMAEGEAADLVDLLRRIGAHIASLEELGDAQRLAVVRAGLYPVTRANLIAALGDDRTMALDVVKGRDPDVYEHIVENLDDYLDSLHEGEVTVEDPGEFLGVLGDLVDLPELPVRTVAQRASDSCEVMDLDALEQAGWQAVVSADRFRPSVANVSCYVAKYGVTPEMAASISKRDLVDAEDLDKEARVTLAYALIGATHLDEADRVRLVGQLKLPDHLDPSELNAEGLSLLPALLGANEVSDEAETYAFVADRPYSFREDYFVSSGKLSSYVTQLPLSSDDLTQVMKSRRVPPAVKRAIADDATFVEGRLSRKGVIAVCEWATKGNDVSTDLLLVLSRGGAPAEHVLGLLEPHLTDIGIDTLDDILRGLGDDYEPLTRLGRHRPRLKSRPGTEQLLDELKRRDRVSSYGDAMLGGIRVNMRH